EKKGTAYSVHDAELAVAGKTGTAQVGKLYRHGNETGWDPDRDHAWFAGYAPASDPKIAFVVMVEHGGRAGGGAPPGGGGGWPPRRWRWRSSAATSGRPRARRRCRRWAPSATTTPRPTSSRRPAGEGARERRAKAERECVGAASYPAAARSVLAERGAEAER